MTELLCSPKIKPEHLARKAIVYLRQSSEKQVRYNLESQRLQYEVADRIRNLGWRDIEIIDSDLGFSAGMASARREGFERVLSLIALGEVGIVGSWEVSRLSRTDKDWCRLLEVCQIFGTLIADEQQLYDLNYLDDQLVLGIKGTLSVVELKVLRQRMQAGQESKARRGGLFKRLPVGYTRDPHARYLCKGDYDDGGQYCQRFGGASVDRRLSQEMLKVISPLGIEASLRALEELSAGDAVQRIALSSKLEQMEYEAKKAFEQYDAVDARNRLVAGELERRWNEKLEEIAKTKQRLAGLNGKRYSLSVDEEAQILAMGANFSEVWQSDPCPSTLKKMIFRTVVEEIIVRTDAEKKDASVHHPLEGRYAHPISDGEAAISH
jgi:DNA invertase Pin-like site-specific DNA recombinase